MDGKQFNPQVQILTSTLPLPTKNIKLSLKSMAKLMHSMYSVSCCSYLLVFISIFLTSVPNSVQSSTLESDIQGLRSLKSSIDPNTIPSSSFLDTWDFKMDPCESSGEHFLGILCTIPFDNSQTRITVIDLDGVGYDGFLAPEIGNLTELTFLNLEKNKFRGPIPDTITNLVKLTTLALSGNFFTGNIPTRLVKLKKLEILDLSRNRLSGSINPVVLRFRSLKELRLSNNGFSGRIPDLHGLWQLHTLDLSTNLLFGNLPRLPINLRTLSLNHNTLSGHISSIRQLQDLRALDLSDNRFSGSIHQGILTLPKVTHVNVSVNRLTSMEVIKFSGRDTLLQVLDAHNNGLHGRLPVNLVTVGNLTRINLGQNKFFGAIPKQYGVKLEGSWQSLYLDHNFLVGNLPPQFNSSTVRGSGSLAQNCLRCPINILWCNGGQRPAAECVGE